MAENALRNRTVLIVEDEYMLADDLRQEMESAGATVVGPIADVAAALRALEQGAAIDGAVLDINLGGDPSFPIADELTGRGIPFLFTTGYDSHALPQRYQDIVRCEKPIAAGSIAASLSRLIGA